MPGSRGRSKSCLCRTWPGGWGSPLAGGDGVGGVLYQADDKEDGNVNKSQLKQITIVPVFKLLYFWGISARYMKRKTVDP